MATDAELYGLRKAMVGKMWTWWRLYHATNGGETADKATAYRLWALRQEAREARYAVLDARGQAALWAQIKAPAEGAGAGR